jgi:hypothetical protein
MLIPYVFQYTTNYQRGNDDVRRKVTYTGNNFLYRYFVRALVGLGYLR